LNQILRRQTSRSHYGSKVPVVTVTVFKYRNKIEQNEQKDTISGFGGSDLVVVRCLHNMALSIMNKLYNGL
jgi:hypothetical protein